MYYVTPTVYLIRVIARQLRALGCFWPIELWVTAGEVVGTRIPK